MLHSLCIKLSQREGKAAFYLFSSIVRLKLLKQKPEVCRQTLHHWQ